MNLNIHCLAVLKRTQGSTCRVYGLSNLAGPPLIGQFSGVLSCDQWSEPRSVCFLGNDMLQQTVLVSARKLRRQPVSCSWSIYIYNASLVMYRIRVAAFCCVWLLALLLLLHPLLMLMIEIGYCYATIRVIEIFQKPLFWAFESNFFHLQGEIFIPKLFQINPTCVITGCSFVSRTFAPRLGD